jgi:hypothetical protein
MGYMTVTLDKTTNSTLKDQIRSLNYDYMMILADFTLKFTDVIEEHLDSSDFGEDSTKKLIFIVPAKVITSEKDEIYSIILSLIIYWFVIPCIIFCLIALIVFSISFYNISYTLS